MGVIVATFIGLIALQFIDPNMSNNLFGTKETNEKNELVEEDGETGSFSINGSVVNPGTYKLKMDGVTMEDLITASGGTNSSADNRCFYLDSKIKNNESYYIPTRYDATDVCGNDELKKVNVNADSVDVLQTISGIGTVLADSIVKYRETNGLYYTIESLMNVSGIGNSKFSQIKDYVILHE